MELQWPLIIFTTLVAWSAGLFAAQCALVFKGEAQKAQLPALITSFVLLCVGGVAVFFHLQHWERIFNGFGHITSGITQELVAIVLAVVVMVVFFVFLRRESGKVPAWVAVLGMAMSAILVCVMAHSYLMAARPAWNSIVWILYVLGNACVLGPATMAVICSLVDKDAASSKLLGMLALVGSAINGLLSIAFLFVMNAAAGSVSAIDYYFDPTEPNRALVDPSTFSVFSGELMLVSVLGVIVIGAIVPIVASVVGSKQKSWALWGSIAAIAAFVGAICMRVVFYQMGFSVCTLF